MTVVYLIRHGAVIGGEGRFIGHTDLSLSAAGEVQVRALAARLSGTVRFDAIYCSDLVRSRRTAELLAEETDLPIAAWSSLREIRMGAWEGLSRSTVTSRFPLEYEARGRDLQDYRVPGGESFADCGRRVLAAWQAILARGEDAIAITAHAGVNRLILCHVLGMPIANMFRIAQDNACLNVIDCDGDRSIVRRLNDTGQ